MSAEIIEKFIKEYMEENPAYIPPDKSQHPCILALTDEINGALVEKAGGIIEFWWQMLNAAKIWFTPNEDSIEYDYFHARLFGACGLSAHTEYEVQMNEIWESFIAWKNNSVN